VFNLTPKTICVSQGNSYYGAMGFAASFSKDPADRVMAATGLVNGLSLLTADRAIRQARILPTIW